MITKDYIESDEVEEYINYINAIYSLLDVVSGLNESE